MHGLLRPFEGPMFDLVMQPPSPEIKQILGVDTIQQSRPNCDVRTIPNEGNPTIA